MIKKQIKRTAKQFVNFGGPFLYVLIYSSTITALKIYISLHYKGE